MASVPSSDPHILSELHRNVPTKNLTAFGRWDPQSYPPEFQARLAKNSRSAHEVTRVLIIDFSLSFDGNH